MKIRQATPKEIREMLGHNDGTRRVRVSRDGRVTYYGWTVPTVDRRHDFWHFGGYVTGYTVEEPT